MVEIKSAITARLILDIAGSLGADKSDYARSLLLHDLTDLEEVSQKNA